MTCRYCIGTRRYMEIYNILQARKQNKISRGEGITKYSNINLKNIL